jgi:lipopolysaccharide transport system ATP-binding protein
MTQKMKNAFTKRDNGLESSELFWALKDVSFEVKDGERIGIIGRNGAGKSTLLKILSRITDPTGGRISIKGRVASLLEVGTGFHPELSGRENIFLNGAILGMSRTEIKSRFDEIVAFAEIDKFLDTPVKRYSSGMYVRLAFAVAAHLEPEILIVDEVLAVGDAQFQKKCLGKMQDVSKNEGRTILFVSHNMQAISALCTSSILLEGGILKSKGDTEELINLYLRNPEKAHGETSDNSQPQRDQKLKIRTVRILDSNLACSAKLNNSSSGFVEVGFEVLKAGRGYDVSIEIKHNQYGSVFTSCLKDSYINGYADREWKSGNYKFMIELPLKIMREGDYIITAGAAIPKVEVLDSYKNETAFSLFDSYSPVAKTGEGRMGSIIPVIEWHKQN